MTAPSNPEADAKVIGSLDHTNNADSAQVAYQKFQTEYSQYAKTHNSVDSSSYLKSVTEQLVANKTLPDIAVAWGADNRNRIGEGGNPGVFDLSLVAHDGNSVDQVMATQLISDFGQVAGVGSGDTSRIHDSDWTAWTDQHQIENVKANSISGLFSSSDGKLNGTLFDYLDSLPGGKHDQKITPDDFKRYIDKYNFDAKNHQLSAEQTPADLKLVQFLNDNWDSPAVKQMRTTEYSYRAPIQYGALTPESMAAAGNFSSAESMIKSEKIEAPTVKKQSPNTELETTTADVFAKNPGLLDTLTDGKGNIGKEQVSNMLDVMKTTEPSNTNNRNFMDIYKMLDGLNKNWDALSKFSNDGDKTINLDKLTAYGFDGKEDFADRLRRDGEQPISQNDRSAVVAYCTNNKLFLADSNGNINKPVIDAVFAHSDRLTAPQRQYVKLLHDSFEYLKTGAETINVNDFTGT